MPPQWTNSGPISHNLLQRHKYSPVNTESQSACQGLLLIWTDVTLFSHPHTRIQVDHSQLSPPDHLLSKPCPPSRPSLHFIMLIWTRRYSEARQSPLCGGPLASPQVNYCSNARIHSLAQQGAAARPGWAGPPGLRPLAPLSGWLHRANSQAQSWEGRRIKTQRYIKHISCFYKTGTKKGTKWIHWEFYVIL